MPRNKEIIINETAFPAGTHATELLNVARLPSGTTIHLSVDVFRSETPGPTMLVLGGVHGDEVNGVEIIRQAISSGMFANLLCGDVIAIPLLNIYGFINFSREVTDGKDVNRSFPGTKNGSLASRVANILTRQILPFVDFGLDFHTGGGSRYNYPQIRYTAEDSQAKELAQAFAAPYTLMKKVIPGSLRHTAKKMEVPVIVFEGGESLRLDQLSIDVGLAGIRRVMQAKGMVADAPSVDHKQYIFEKSTWVRAGRSGIFIWAKSSGQEVKAGEVLGMIHEPHGKDHTPVLADIDGIIVGHNNAPVVSQGDALFNIGIVS